MHPTIALAQAMLTDRSMVRRVYNADPQTEAEATETHEEAKAAFAAHMAAKSPAADEPPAA